MINKENIEWLKQFNSMSEKVDNLINAARLGTAKSDLDNWLELEKKTKQEKAQLEREQLEKQKELKALKDQEDEWNKRINMTEADKEKYRKERQKKWDKLVRDD